MRRFFFNILLIILILIIEIGITPAAFALTVSPVKLEIAGDPGQTLTGEFELFNEQKEVKTFYSSFENFEARGESGAPYFTGCAKNSLCSWIKTTSSIALNPGKRKKIPYSIKIPKNAEPGGHFAAVFWGTAPPQEKNKQQVVIGGRVGILVMLSISGKTKSKGEGLVEFSTDRGKKLLSSLPITFIWRFSNQGRQRIKPTGEITIKNMFGGTAAVADANRRDGNVLPGSIRKFEVIWFEKNQKKSAVAAPETEKKIKEKQGFFSSAKNQWRKFTFGIYTAKLNFTYSKGNKTKTSKASYLFLVIPWQILSIIFAILAVFVFLVVIGIKKYNRWIVAKASRIQKQQSIANTKEISE